MGSMEHGRVVVDMLDQYIDTLHDLVWRTAHLSGLLGAFIAIHYANCHDLC